MNDIVVEAVDKTFPTARGKPRELFRDLNFRFAAGTTISIVGSSGCGKSTLLNILAGLEPFDRGRVLLDRKRLGYLFQRDALLPWKNAIDNAIIPLLLRQEPRANARTKAQRLFSRMGLSELEEAYPGTMSGGQRQRVALAQNLLADPTVLLLDEPFGSLDYQTKLNLEGELLSILRSAPPANQCTCVFVTHDIEEAIVMGDRVLVLGQPGEGIVLDCQIVGIPRHPIDARRTPLFQTYFGQVWQSLAAGLAITTALPPSPASDGGAR